MTARFAIAIGRFYQDLAERLVGGAQAAFADGGFEEADEFDVPGAFELPLAADALARSGRVDAVVCLGVVVRGGTPHFDYVCRSVTDGCSRVALDRGMPVGFGVLTVDTLEQALERAGGAHGDKGRESVQAVLELLATLDEVNRAPAGRSPAPD